MQRRVDLAQVGAVREAVVVDLLRAQREPDAVHVGHRVGGLDVLQQRAADLGAGLRVRRSLVQPRLIERGRLRHVVRPVVTGVVDVAAQRRNAGADAARVEADPVVLAADAAGHELTEHRQGQAGSAGASGVGQHHALVVLRGRRVLDPRDGELDLRTGRRRVVQRHRDEATFRVTAGQRGVVADPPDDRRGCVGGAGRGLRGGRDHAAADREAERRGDGSRQEFPHSMPFALRSAP